MLHFSRYCLSVWTVFRQGDIGTSWYAVLSGSLDVKVSETANHQVKNLSRMARVGMNDLLFLQQQLTLAPFSVNLLE